MTRSQRWTLALSVAVLAGATIEVPAARTPILRAAGWALVVDEPVEPADIIVVTVDAHRAGMLEAADLVHQGIATRVAVFANPPDDADREFIRRGVPYEDEASQSIQQLRLLGVANIEQIPRTVGGTEDEGLVLPGWCDQRGFGSVVVVSVSDHARRVRRVLDRSMKGHRTRVTVRSARHSQFDPDRWWQTRGGTRSELEELAKLLLDLARHPLS
jgi:hypothetical protein